MLTCFSTSRQALKKYVQANNNLSSVTDAAFTTQFNRALAKGSETGVFERPKGKPLLHIRHYGPGNNARWFNSILTSSRCFWTRQACKEQGWLSSCPQEGRQQEDRDQDQDHQGRTKDRCRQGQEDRELELPYFLGLLC